MTIDRSALGSEQTLTKEQERAGRGPKPWAYFLAAVIGSLTGSFADLLLWEGGYTLAKVGLVAGPALLYAISRRRANDAIAAPEGERQGPDSRSEAEAIDGGRR